MTISPNAKAYISMTFTAFIGGVIGFLGPVLADGALPPETKWKAMVIGAVFAGFVAVWHRYQIPPDDASKKSQSGFGRVEALIACVVIAGSTGAVVIAACSPATTAADKNVAQCILTAAGEGATQGLDGAPLVLFIEGKCLASEIDVLTTLAAAKKLGNVHIPDAGSTPAPASRNPGF